MDKAVPVFEARQKCYRCYRPMSSCMCGHIRPVKTQTKFVILMHPKEFRKVKNGTGHLTHLSLENSELYIGIDFSGHKEVNGLIEDPSNSCYLLYPSKKSILLNDHDFSAEKKNRVFFILDATWDCSKKMLRLSRNLQALRAVSFEHTRKSQFEIKTQPKEHFLSTIESTLSVLELLNANANERIDQAGLESFLNPFKAMIAYQQSCISPAGGSFKNAVRFKKRT